MAERPKHDPLAALRQPNCALYSLNRSFAAIGSSMLTAVMAWQVYAISGSVLDLGYLALARFGAALATSLIGGVVADTFDRRLVMASAKVVPLTCALVLALATAGGWVQLELIFGLVILIGFASSFEGPAGSTAGNRPTGDLCKRRLGHNMVQRLGSISGPTLGGFVIDATGIATAYAVFCGTLADFSRSLATTSLPASTDLKAGTRHPDGSREPPVRPSSPRSPRRDVSRHVCCGLRWRRRSPPYLRDRHPRSRALRLRHFGLVDAGRRLPDIPAARSAPAVRHTGRVLVYSVIIYGLATIGFGLSREFLLAAAFYSVLGAFDQISVVRRQQIIQMSTPDELRGRVSAVYQVFLGASNQGGPIESSFVAAATSATFAVVSGGVGAIASAALIGWRMPKLLHYESGDEASARSGWSDSAAPN